MDVLIGLIDLIEGTWMIFLYYMFGYIVIFLNHLTLPTRFKNIMFLNISTQTSALNTDKLTHFRFYMSEFVEKKVHLSLVFTESSYLVRFLPIMKVSTQRTKKDRCKHPEMLCKKGVGLQLYLKRYCGTGVFLGILRNF